MTQFKNRLQVLVCKTKAAAGAVYAIASCVPNCQSMNKETLGNFKGFSQDR
jgi:hypothetical protein